MIPKSWGLFGIMLWLTGPRSMVSLGLRGEVIQFQAQAALSLPVLEGGHRLCRLNAGHPKAS